MATEAKEVKKQPKGLIAQSLYRNNKQIRDDRATDIYEELQISFKRECEDLDRDVKSLERQRKALYDFSPTNSQSLVMAKELNGYDIVKADKALMLQIRIKRIELEEMANSYEELFGQPFNS